ncbi:hypothetical protein [Paenibacillus marinisediminis]
MMNHYPESLIPRKQTFIRDKRKFRNALIGITVLMILMIRFPHGYSWLEMVYQVLGIKTVFDIGNGQIMLTGLPILIGIIVFLRMLYQSLDRSRGLVTFLAFLVIMNLPAQLVTAYQANFASGINALSFEKQIASCQYKYSEADSAWLGECSMSVKNYSNKPVDMQITLVMQTRDSQRSDLEKVTLDQQQVMPGDQWLHIPVNIPVQSNQKPERISDMLEISYSYSEAIVTDGTRERRLLETY